MLDPDGRPVKRNFVHVDDLVDAILAGARQPRGAARRRSTSAWTSRSTTASSPPISPQTRGLPTRRDPTPYHSIWLDNTKAKLLLGWRPRYDLARLTDEAWAYRARGGRPADRLVSGLGNGLPSVIQTPW